MRINLIKVSDRIKFILLLYLATTRLHGQMPEAPLIQSPNVASLGIFGTIPVNYYTGVPDISIPIYTIKSGNITIPVSLQYHPASVKPNQHPGWVGLGWNLNCTGLITRQTKWFVDENDYTPSNYPAYYQTGSKLLDNKQWDSSKKMIEYFEKRIDRAYPDPEADEFYFSFLGYSGRFIYTYEGWKVISDHNIKVEFNDEYISRNDFRSSINDQLNDLRVNTFDMQSQHFKGFTLVTEDGTRYIFGGADAIEYYCGYMNDIDAFIANTWYLKEIIDPDNNRVEFTYRRGYPICDLAFTSGYYDMSCSRQNDWVRGRSYYYHGYADTSYRSGTIILPMYLSRISSVNDSIVFETSFSKEKMYSESYLNYLTKEETYIPIELNNIEMPDKGSRSRGFKWEQLDRIKVMRKSGESLTDYSFYYSASLTERLTLNKITESQSNQTYTFLYDDIPGLPDYGGDQTDHWGYFNGRSVQGYSFQALYTQKNTKTDKVTKGLLKKISYPAGGYTEFDWEAHQYAKVVSTNRQSVSRHDGFAGGSRIKEVRSYASSNAAPIKKTFYYVSGYNGGNPSANLSSGILNGIPQYLFYISERPTSDYPEKIKITQTYGIISGMKSYSYNAMGTHIGYSEVVEKNTDGSYNKYIFTNYDTDMHGISHFDHKASYLGWKEDEDVYIPTSSLECERGKPLAEYVYNANNMLLKSIIRQYDNAPSRFNSFIKRVELRERIGCAYAELLLAAAYKSYTYHYNVISIEEKEYNLNGQSPVTKTQTFKYNKNNQINNKIISQSDGITITEEYRYPIDLMGSVPIFDKMVEANIISPLIGKTLLIENAQKVIRAEYNQYREFYPGIIKPDTAFRMEATVPVPADDFYGKEKTRQSLSNHTSKATDRCIINIEDKPGNLSRISLSLAYEFEHQADPYYKGEFSLKIEGPVTKTFYSWDLSYSDRGTYYVFDVKDDFPAPPGTYTFTLTYLTERHPNDEFVGNAYITATQHPVNNRKFMKPASFYHYNEAGKIIEIQSKGTAKDIYVWGYKGQYPVARIQNSTYKDVSGFIGQADMKVLAGNPSDDDIRRIFNKLQKLDSMKEAQVSYFTYKPPVGITSETDPSGRTIFYEYDSFGRLSAIKDINQDIIKDYTYQY